LTVHPFVSNKAQNRYIPTVHT